MRANMYPRDWMIMRFTLVTCDDVKLSIVYICIVDMVGADMAGADMTGAAMAGAARAWV